MKVGQRELRFERACDAEHGESRDRTCSEWLRKFRDYRDCLEVTAASSEAGR